MNKLPWVWIIGGGIVLYLIYKIQQSQTATAAVTAANTASAIASNVGTAVGEDLAGF